MIFSFYFFGSRELRYLYKIPSQLPKITIRSTNKVSLNRYQRSNCKGNMVMDHFSEGRPPRSHFAVSFIILRKASDNSLHYASDPYPLNFLYGLR